MRTHVARLPRLSLDNARRLIDAAREHLLIVEAIMSGNSPLAADVTLVHLQNSLRSILASTVDRPAPVDKPTVAEKRA